jgi:hypothetical protein
MQISYEPTGKHGYNMPASLIELAKLPLHDQLQKFEALLNMFYKCSSYSDKAMRNGAIGYGSVLWQIAQQLSVDGDTSVALSLMIDKHFIRKSDVDMFMDSSWINPYKTSANTHYQKDASVYYLAYPLQNLQDAYVFRTVQEIMASGDPSEMYRIDELMQKIKDEKLMIDTVNTVKELGDTRTTHFTKFQIHFTDASPTKILKEYVAPLFTPESLMYSRQDGFSCRFHDDLHSVLQDVYHSRMRIINADLVAKHMEGRDGAREIFKERLLKYAKHGFRLVLSAADLEHEFLRSTIEVLHFKKVRYLTKVQKKCIASMTSYNVAVTDEQGMYTTAQLLEKQKSEENIRNNALAAQALYQDYITACIDTAINAMPTSVISLITEYAARCNELVYFEDAELRLRLDRIEKERQAVLHELAGHVV